MHKPNRLLETERHIRAVGLTQMRSMEERLPICEIIALPVPLTDETRRRVNESLLDKMKAGSVPINTSRGSW